jgi:uncharacterized protein YlaN (UPF0358 family)
MIEKFKQLTDLLSDEEAAKISELILLLLDNYKDGKINIYSEVKDFDIFIIYKVLNLFSNEEQTN